MSAPSATARKSAISRSRAFHNPGRCQAAGVVLSQKFCEAGESCAALCDVVVVPAFVPWEGVADAVEAACFEGIVQPYFFAGGAIEGVERDVVHCFPQP